MATPFPALALPRAVVDRMALPHDGTLVLGQHVGLGIVDDPWTEPGTYDLRERENGPLYSGEGSLLYPGRDAGYEGVGASLRLKALRLDRGL